MSRTGDDIAEATADAIAKAIRQVEAKGVAATTSDTKLAQLAGVGRSTLYRAFKLRPALLTKWNSARAPSAEDELRNDELTRLRDRLRAANQKVSDLESLLEAYASAIHGLVLEQKMLRASLADEGKVVSLPSRKR